jgi:hypothetical protein
MLAYMANGVYDPGDPDYEAPTAEFFQREIVNRSDAEIAEDRAAAITF